MRRRRRFAPDRCLRLTPCILTVLAAAGFALASCTGRVLAPTAFPTAAPAATGTQVPAPAASATPSTTPTTTPPPPTAAVSTPPIAHLAPGQDVIIGHIWMTGPQHGWTVGGTSQDGTDHVLRTADGGETWTDVTPPEPGPEQGQAKAAVGMFLDDETGWVIYAYRQFHIIPSGVVWSTHDGGATWTASQPLDIGELFEFFSPSNMTFIDAQHGWVMVHAGAGMMHDYMSLYRTIDGGLMWQQEVAAGGDQIQVCPKTGMAFADPDHGWITRDCGGVIDGAFVDVTADGGENWDSLQLPAPASEPHLFDSGASACAMSSPRLFSTEQGALAVRCVTGATDADVHTYFYRTSDSGATWQVYPYPGGQLRFFDSLSGVALSRTIASTSDGGVTWTRIKTVNWDGQFSFVDPTTGWAVARDQGQIALVATSDGGRTWREIRPRVAP